MVTASLQKRSGFAMIVALMCMILLSALAVSMVTMSSISTGIADNKRNSENALSASLSGIEIMRYWLNGVNSPTGSEAIATINTELNSAFLSAGATNISSSLNGSQINISLVSLDTNTSFIAAITQIDSDTVRATISGTSSQITKSVSVDFDIVSRGSSVFDYGVATRGPLRMSGQSEIAGVNLAVESSVYIEGQLSGDAFSITNQASVAGEVFIADEYATYDVGNKSSVGGETGADAAEHIILGTPPSTFPTPNPAYFESFATGAVIDSSTDISSLSSLDNVTIAAGTNPSFASDMEINGVLFIEIPNVVNFSGRVTVTGIIVGDGIVGDSSPENGLVFSGQVECFDVEQLTGVEFEDISQETGTFILAPGFSVDFSGQTTVDNGAIAASGISFTGQAGGTINGSIINYSTDPVVMSGQSTLLFNRSGTETNPAGFGPVTELDYRSSTYQEPL